MATKKFVTIACNFKADLNTGSNNHKYIPVAGIVTMDFFLWLQINLPPIIEYYPFVFIEIGGNSEEIKPSLSFPKEIEKIIKPGGFTIMSEEDMQSFFGFGFSSFFPVSEILINLSEKMTDKEQASELFKRCLESNTTIRNTFGEKTDVFIKEKNNRNNGND